MTENEQNGVQLADLESDAPVPKFVIAPGKKKISLKQVYVNAKGHEVSLDFFLFTSFEEEQTVNSFKGKFREAVDDKRWPRLADDSIGALGIGELVEEICQWYAAEHPALAGIQPLDYEVHGQLTRSFALFFQDLATMVAARNGAAFYYEPGEKELDEVWEVLESALGKSFPGYSRLMLGYLKWRHIKSSPIQYDLATLPPVGRFTPMLQREARKSRAAGVRNSRQLAEKGSEADLGAPVSNEGAVEDVPTVRDSEIALGKQSNGPALVKSKADDKRSSEREVEAKAFVDAAVSALNADLQLPAVSLPPCNSYLRRLQHKYADEAGFSSKSVGVGSERGVEIVRR